MIFTKIDTVMVRVAHLETAQGWYEEKFDLTPAYFDDEQRIVVMEGEGETSITLWERKEGEADPPAPKAGAYPIFFTEDIEDAHRRLRGRGVNVGEIEGDATRWFGFTDPDGNWMEICTY